MSMIPHDDPCSVAFDNKHKSKIIFNEIGKPTNKFKCEHCNQVWIITKNETAGRYFIDRLVS